MTLLNPKNELKNRENHFSMSISEEFRAGFEEIRNQPLNNIKHVGVSIPIPTFSKESVIDLCDEAIKILKLQPTLVPLKGPLVIVGDLHGNMHDLLRILSTYGYTPMTQYLFLGDYVDRGSFSIETILILLTEYVQNPSRITLLRGNHELKDVNSTYGFREEFDSANYDEELYYKINEVFDYFPISAVIDKQVFCVHGGICSDLHDLRQIYNTIKPITLENISGMIKKLLWSDPSYVYESYGATERGYGEAFGFLALGNFCSSTKIKLVIRAHEKQEKGYSAFGNNCLTVFSSSGYFNNNQGAVLCYKDPNSIIIRSYNPIDHITKKNALFFKMCNSRTQHDPKAYISSFPSLTCIKPSKSLKSMKKAIQQFSSANNPMRRVHATIPKINTGFPKLKTF